MCEDLLLGTNKPCGPICMLDILLYCDGPLLFVAVGPGPTLYLGWPIHEDEPYTCLLKPVSEEQMDAYRSGKVDLLETILAPPGRLLQLELGNELVEVDANDVLDDLPLTGLFHEGDSTPRFVEWLRDELIERFRKDGFEPGIVRPFVHDSTMAVYSGDGRSAMISVYPTGEMVRVWSVGDAPAEASTFNHWEAESLVQSTIEFLRTATP